MPGCRVGSDAAGRRAGRCGSPRSSSAAPVQAAVAIVLTVLMSAQTAAMAVLLGTLTTDVAAGRWQAASSAAVTLGVVVVAGLGVTWAAFGVRTVLEEKTLVAVDAGLLGRVAGLDGLAAFERAGPADDLAVLRRDRARLGNLLIIMMTMLGAGVQLLLTVGAADPPHPGTGPAAGARRAPAAGRPARGTRTPGGGGPGGASRPPCRGMVASRCSPGTCGRACGDRNGRAGAGALCGRRPGVGGLLHRGERRRGDVVLLGNAIFALGCMSAVAVGRTSSRCAAPRPSATWCSWRRSARGSAARFR